MPIFRVNPNQTGGLIAVANVPAHANVVVHDEHGTAVLVRPFTPETPVDGCYLQDGTLVVFALETYIVTAP